MEAAAAIWRGCGCNIAAATCPQGVVQPPRAAVQRPHTRLVHPLLRVVADRQDGVFTAADARRAGYEHAEIRHLLASRSWVRLRHGIYISGTDLAVSEKRVGRHRLDCLAVLLSVGRSEAAISHSSAAQLWGLPLRRDRDRTIRLTDPLHSRRGKGYGVTRAPLPSRDVAVREALRLTTPARTLVDCAREWPLEDAVIAMDAALLADRTTLPDLRLAAAAAKGWRGAARAARAVELADGRAESALETRGRLRIVGAGLPTPELQVEIRVRGRLVAVVDAWFEEAAVAVEFDGRVKYTDPWRGRDPAQVLWEEKRREDDLRALDIRVTRMVDADVGPGWPHIEARLRTQLAQPGPTRRAFTATPREHGRRRAG
jgi:predicted transcriptional regulator of viral defense system